jgi:fatty acid desaturase
MFRGKMRGADVREVMEMRSRVKSEVDLYHEMRKAVMAQDGRDGAYVASTLLLLVASAAIMATWYEALILWVIVTFLLYSFNYVVFFLPITRHPGERRVKERGDAASISFNAPCASC